MPGWQFGQLPGSVGWLKSPSQGPPGDHLLTDLRADFSREVWSNAPSAAMPDQGGAEIRPPARTLSWSRTPEGSSSWRRDRGSAVSFAAAWTGSYWVCVCAGPSARVL